MSAQMPLSYAWRDSGNGRRGNCALIDRGGWAMPRRQTALGVDLYSELRSHPGSLMGSLTMHGGSNDTAGHHPVAGPGLRCSSLGTVLRLSPNLGGYDVPIQSYAFNAFVHETMKPVMDTVRILSAYGAYFSHSAKVGLVIGGGLERVPS